MSDPEPFNLDAVGADIKSFRFTFGGQSFELPSLAVLPFDVALRYTQAEEHEALKLLLGDEQWERFIALSPSFVQVRELAAQWFAFQGITPPESLASTGSSESTAEQSRQTSSGTTG